MKFNLSIYRTIKDYLTNFLKYGIIGNSIKIEASSICQLKCVECIQSKDLMEVIGRGYLKYKDYKRFVDRYPSFRQIELSNWGEIFLNPELKEIIEYSCKKNIALKALNGVNLNTINEEMIETLVKYGFRSITVCIDGTSNETYQLYRRGGDFNRVIGNIKKINYYKHKYNTSFPELKWQFVVFGHNEHEIPKARMMASELNMNFALRFNTSKTYSPVKNIDFVRREMGAVSRWEYRQKYDKLFMFYCNQLWTDPQINWDGKLLGCCVNKWGDFGNVFELGLKRCLKSAKYFYAKQMVTGRKEARKDIPCFYCGNYREMLSNKVFFKQFHFYKIFIHRLIVRRIVMKIAPALRSFLNPIWNR